LQQASPPRCLIGTERICTRRIGPGSAHDARSKFQGTAHARRARGAVAPRFVDARFSPPIKKADAGPTTARRVLRSGARDARQCDDEAMTKRARKPLTNT